MLNETYLKKEEERKQKKENKERKKGKRRKKVLNYKNTGFEASMRDTRKLTYRISHSGESTVVRKEVRNPFLL